MYAKSIDFQKKKWTCDLLNASQLLYPLRYMAVVIDGILLEFSPLFCLQPAEYKLITASPHNDKLEVVGWLVYGVKQLICRSKQSHLSYQHDRETDGQTDRISALYIQIQLKSKYFNRAVSCRREKFWWQNTLSQILFKSECIENCTNIHQYIFLQIRTLSYLPKFCAT